MFDIVITNPPFDSKSYGIFNKIILFSNNISILVHYLFIINSNSRTRLVKNFGIKKITHLPRGVFDNSKVQTCILFLESGFKEDTIFNLFEDLK